MRAHYLQHVPFEGLGSIEAWLKTAGYEITCTKFYESAELPRVDEVDFLVVMGGPMSVNEENTYPWLVKEKAFIKRVVESGKPTLGICLGAQLIACAKGGSVFPNAVKEIGWFPVRTVTSTNSTAFMFPEEVEVFHWHGETFSLPPEASRIAESKGCKNQAFQIGNSVIGLQFHLETTPELARLIVENCRDELVTDKYIQSTERILSASPERYLSINKMMNDVLEYLHHNNG